VGDTEGAVLRAPVRAENTTLVHRDGPEDIIIKPFYITLTLRKHKLEEVSPREGSSTWLLTNNELA